MDENYYVKNYRKYGISRKVLKYLDENKPPEYGCGLVPSKEMADAAYDELASLVEKLPYKYIEHDDGYDAILVRLEDLRSLLENFEVKMSYAARRQLFINVFNHGYEFISFLPKERLWFRDQEWVINNKLSYEEYRNLLFGNNNSTG